MRGFAFSSFRLAASLKRGIKTQLRNPLLLIAAAIIGKIINSKVDER